MLSCDTFAASKQFTVFQENFFGKNSDRPLGEAQPLVVFPAAHHAEGEMLQCTNLRIPQAENTYAMIGSKPYWIWGFEMGINEHSVCIGNEAQLSRIAESDSAGMLGMDMLRLGLERGRTARESAQVIISMLETYGQDANANLVVERHYENSYMIVDPKEILLLETAGRHWVMRRIDGMQGISNCYAIHTEFDSASSSIEELAVSKGWKAKDEPFDFAATYTQPSGRQTNAVGRYRMINRLLQKFGNTQSFETGKIIFRNHFEGELMEPRFSAGYGTFVSICMHAMTWDTTQTASSMLVTYSKNLGIVGRHTFSIPCGSVYMPIYFTGYLPETMQTGGEKFSDQSAWWRAERLNMLISADYNAFSGSVQAEIRSLEQRFDTEAAANESIASGLIEEGHRDQAFVILNNQMDQHTMLIQELVERQTAAIKGNLLARGGLCGLRADFLREYSQRVEMPLL